MKTRQGTERTTKGTVILIMAKGNEPDCPACGNSNAMLHHVIWNMGNTDASKPDFVDALKCRDCGFIIPEAEASIREFSSYREAKAAIDEGLFDADYAAAPKGK